jgi:multiple sugar transport system permease protein
MRRSPLLPYLLIAPSVLFLLVFFLVPFVQTVGLAFTVDGEVSTGNFSRMANDLNFWPAVRNTFGLVIVVVPLQVALALAMAVMIQKMGRGRDLVMWIWTIPLGVSDLAAGLAWLAIMSNTGYFNTVLFHLGVVAGPTAWLTYETPLGLFLAVVAAEVWRATALVFVILVAGLQLVPKEYGEAAEVFGASPWQRFCRVTLPLLKPSLQSALILRTVLAFEAEHFDGHKDLKTIPLAQGEAIALRRAIEPWVRYRLVLPDPGAYSLLVRYAATDPAPVQLEIEGKFVDARVLGDATHGETPAHFRLGVVQLGELHAGRCFVRF